MSNRPRFLFGKPPFRFLAEHLAQDDDFVQDARVLLAIPTAQVPDLTTRLQGAAGFLGKGELAGCAQSAGVDDPKAVADIINRLGGVIHDAEMPSAKAMEAFREVILEKCDKLNEAEREELCSRIRSLVAEPKGVALQFKSRQLTSAVGSSLESYGLICDIRPVFDSAREKMEGAVAISTLRLDYITQEAEQETIELRVNEHQIDGLVEKLKESKRKLSIIKEMLNTWSVPVPSTGVHIDERLAE